MLCRRLTGPAALALAATIASAGIALAAGPVKGARYSGKVKVTATLTVAFKVSKSGQRVTSLKVSPVLPNTCGYGGPLVPKQSSKPATIKNGRFTAKVTAKSTSGVVIGSATVTGRFLAHGKEAGTIKTGAKPCAGTFAYTTKAKRA